jgi:hypothetical protein
MYGVASSCDSETNTRRIRGTQLRKTTPPFKGEHLEWLAHNLSQGQAHKVPCGWLKTLVHLESPTMIGCAIAVGCTGKSSVRKVIHLNTIQR